MRTIAVASGLLAGFTGCGDGDVDRSRDEPRVDASTVPSVLLYPSGPYGTLPGAVIRNHQWVGYVDTAADSDRTPFNEESRPVELATYFRDNDPGAKVIMIDSGAGWCRPCQEEAGEMGGVAEVYEPRGVRFLSALFEDANMGERSTLDFVESWGDLYNLPFATVADPYNDMMPYNLSGWPMHVIVRARDMVIIDIFYGGGSDSTNLKNKLDGYIVDNP